MVPLSSTVKFTCILVGIWLISTPVPTLEILCSWFSLFVCWSLLLSSSRCGCSLCCSGCFYCENFVCLVRVCIQCYYVLSFCFSGIWFFFVFFVFCVVSCWFTLSASLFSRLQYGQLYARWAWATFPSMCTSQPMYMDSVHVSHSTRAPPRSHHVPHTLVSFAPPKPGGWYIYPLFRRLFESWPLVCCFLSLCEHCSISLLPPKLKGLVLRHRVSTRAEFPTRTFWHDAQTKR